VLPSSVAGFGERSEEGKGRSDEGLGGEGKGRKGE